MPLSALWGVNNTYLIQLLINEVSLYKILKIVLA